MNCQEAIDVMDQALDRLLDPGLRTGFEEHMLECGPCRNYLEQLEVTREAVRNLPPETGTSPKKDELIDVFTRERKNRREP